MKRRPARGRVGVVLQQTPQGWRTVRAVVPPRARSVRSEGVPRPPSFRFTAAGAEDGGAVVDELRQLAELRGVVELGSELLGVATKKLGEGPALLLLFGLLAKGKRR